MVGGRLGTGVEVMVGVSVGGASVTVEAGVEVGWGAAAGLFHNRL